MTTKNCANVPKLVLKDLCKSLLCEMSYIRLSLYLHLESIPEHFGNLQHNCFGSNTS